MTEEESAIRELIAIWMRASAAGDLDTVLGLMTDDVLFMVPGAEPFGKEKFAAAAATMRRARLEGTSEVRELEVKGDWAFARSYLQVAMTPPPRRDDPARGLGAVDPAEGCRRPLAHRARRQPAFQGVRLVPKPRRGR
jgi:uncharacterized protein (TIGR02246 family)